MLALVGAIVWPLAIGLARGYVKSRVGVDPTSCARVAGRRGRCLRWRLPRRSPGQQTLLTLVVVGVPFAVLLSTVTRFAARKSCIIARAKVPACATW